MCISKRFLNLITAVGFVFTAGLQQGLAQQQPAANPVGQPAANQGFFGGQGNGFFPGNQGNQGGSAQADFDSLIDLITSTVAADSWMENGTGEGEISPFAINGVYADTSGILRVAEDQAELSSLQSAAKEPANHLAQNVKQSSPLRFVSLPRLEAEITRRQSESQPLDVEMLTLAGLQRIEYIITLPESGDLILAGPAGDWDVRRDGIIVNAETGNAVVRLDDLLTLWRRNQASKSAAFGCSIIPRQAALAKTQEFLQQSASQALEPTECGKWLNTLRDTLGEQDVEFFGMEATSHVAQVLLVADFHMKLIGMGIVDGVAGVRDYLSTVELQANGSPPPMSVLRWWFAMNYEPCSTSADRNVFQLKGQGVQVLSENELLAARGQRIHTGQSDELNRQFAESFTEHFEEISQRYPLYGELRNVFDIAMVLSLIEQEGLTEKVGWEPSLFLDDTSLRLPKVKIAKTVETVINHRIIRRKHIVAGISGGVWVDSKKNLKIRRDEQTAVAKELKTVAHQPFAKANWWWDQQTPD